MSMNIDKDNFYPEYPFLPSDESQPPISRKRKRLEERTEQAVKRENKNLDIPYSQTPQRKKRKTIQKQNLNFLEKEILEISKEVTRIQQIPLQDSSKNYRKILKVFRRISELDSILELHNEQYKRQISATTSLLERLYNLFEREGVTHFGVQPKFANKFQNKLLQLLSYTERCAEFLEKKSEYQICGKLFTLLSYYDPDKELSTFAQKARSYLGYYSAELDRKVIRKEELNTIEIPRSPVDVLLKEQIINRLPQTIFPGSKGAFFKPLTTSGPMSFYLKEEALKINHQEIQALKKLGGEEIFLESDESEFIQAMHFESSNFEKMVESSLNKLNLIEEIEIRLIKSDLIRKIRLYEIPHSSGRKLDTVNHLCACGILEKQTLPTFLEKLKEELNIEAFDILNRIHSKEILVLYFPVIKKDLQPSLRKITSIICGGAGVWFPIYKPLICRLLMNGINVVGFNYRGYGESSGIPSEKKLYQDVETVFSYLKMIQPTIQEEDLILYGNCMGLSVALGFCRMHPKVNLIADRSFASFSRLIESILKKDSSIKGAKKNVMIQLAKLALPWLIDFENSKHIGQVQGNILMITDKKDEIVPQEERFDLAFNTPLSDEKIIHHMITAFGHSGNWLRNLRSLTELEAFLSDTCQSKG